jgi:hypothetical protein
VDQFRQWLFGTVGAGNPMYLTQYDEADQFALTVQHKATDADDYKGFKVLDKDSEITFEIAALGSGDYADTASVYINTNVTKLTVSDLRNWTSNSDVFINAHRTTAGTTGSFVPVQVEYYTAVQPTDGYGGSATIPDEVGIQCTTLAQNTASGAGQNADVSLRAAEFVCIAYEDSGTRSMAALTLGMHTAEPQISVLDHPTVFDDFYGACGIILLTQDNSARTGFGTNTAPNCGIFVHGDTTWKYSFASMNAANERLFSVDSGGSIRFRGNLLWEPGVAGQTINGDLSNATDSSRLMFTTTTADGNADIGIRPHGTATKAAFSAFGSSNVSAAEGIRMYCNGTGALAVLESFKTGAATAREISIRPGQTEALRLLVNGNVCFPDAGLATNATAGFLYIPSCAGTPTGVPDVFAGTVPLVYDRTNNELYIYDGSWISTTAFA